MGIIAIVYNVYTITWGFGFKYILAFNRVYIVSFLTGAIVGILVISCIFMYILNYKIYINKNID